MPVAPGTPSWTCPDTKTVFPTGLLRPPPQKFALSLANKTPFRPTAAPPVNSGWFPTYRSYYGNDTWGICVTAEEAYVKSCYGYNIPDSVVIAWARQHGVLNGASLEEVLVSMRAKGFQVGAQLYNDGPSYSVDYTNPTALRAAAVVGPVKIAIDSSCLPGGAGSRDGWYSLSTRGRGSDHCVALSGQCEAGWCFDQLKLPLPSGLSGSTRGYPLYTWAHIGFVTDDWVNGATDEADVRDPTNIGIPPLAPPVPPTPPTAPPINGTIYAEQFNGVTAIRGEIQTADGNWYIATPAGGGRYNFIPKRSL